MPAPPSSRGRGPAGVPLVVWAATLAFGALGSLWSVTAPLAEAPDETAHLALIWHLADGQPYPDYDQFQPQAGSFRVCFTYASATRACPRRGEEVTRTSTRRHPVAEAPNKATRPAWDDAGGAEAVGPLNQMPQHPPGYYRGMAAVLQVERAVLGGPLSADRELALLRLVNVVLITPLPLLAWWAARRFGYGGSTATAAAMVPFAIPMLTHIGSTVNNDNLLVLCFSVVTALLAGVVRGDRSVRTAVLVGLATALAFLTKGFAILIPPIVLLAYLVGTHGVGRGGWRVRLGSVVRPLAVAGGVVVVLSGWWYLRVWRRTGQFAPSLEAQRLTAELQPEGFSPQVGAFATEFSEALQVRFWGSFGWYSVSVPTWVAVLATMVLIGAAAAAFAPGPDESGATRWQRLVLIVPMALLAVFTLARSWDLYVTTGGFRFIQGRYLFGGMVGLAVLVSAGVARWCGRWAPVVVACVAVVAQIEAFRRVLPGWWGDVGLGPRGQSEALVAYSGLPGEAIGLLLVAAVASGLWLAWNLVRGVLREGVGDQGRPVVSAEP